MCMFCPTTEKAIRTLCAPKNERRPMTDDETDLLLQFIQHYGPSATPSTAQGGAAAQATVARQAELEQPDGGFPAPPPPVSRADVQALEKRLRAYRKHEDFVDKFLSEVGECPFCGNATRTLPAHHDKGCPFEPVEKCGVLVDDDFSDEPQPCPLRSEHEGSHWPD